MEKNINDQFKKITNRGSWHYHIEWYTNERRGILIDEIERQVVNLLSKWCSELKLHLIKITVTPYMVQLLMDASTQINSSKTLRMLQRKLSKSLYREFPTLRNVEGELWDSLYLICTHNRGKAELDIRIEKFLKSLWEVRYYDLEETFASSLNEFKDYLRHRNLGIVDYGDRVFLIDQEALVKEINLNCFECTKIYQYGCCCGSPCGFSSKNMNMFDNHILNIENEIKNIDEEQYKELLASGGLVTANGAIKEYNGHCSLLVKHEGSYKCIAHKYGLEHNIPIYDLCPLSCLMYPLEIMELMTDKQKKIILLTSVLDEYFADRFGRWGSYKSLEVDLRCVDKSAHNEIFREEDYKPVYSVNKNLLIHELGLEVYKGIENIVKK